MNLLGAVKDKLKPSEWLKDLFFGGVAATALSIIYQFFEVLKKQPELLLKWGPNFIFWILGITLAAILVNNLIDAIREGGKSFAEGQERTTAAITRLADAQQDMATNQRETNAQGNKQLDEIQTGVGYAAAQNEEIMCEQRELRTLLKEHIESVRDERKDAARAASGGVAL